MTTGVYLLHFCKPYRHARHYIGYADNIEDRLEQHFAGNGARLTQVVREAKITVVCVRMWPGKDRAFERRLKNRKNAHCLCPVCNPRSAHRNALIHADTNPDVDL